MMAQDLIRRYQPASDNQPEGDIYSGLVEKYGQAVADNAAAAALSGDEYSINQTIAGARLNDSFWSNLGGQLYNDPFNAPIEQANKIFSNAGKALKKAISDNIGNPLLWAGIIGGGILIFWWVGGFKLIRGIAAK